MSTAPNWVRDEPGHDLELRRSGDGQEWTMLDAEADGFDLMSRWITVDRGGLVDVGRMR